MNVKNLTDNLEDLPKWAQSEIRILKMRLDESKKELHRINENEISNTIVGFHDSFQGEQVKYLKNNQMVTFMFENEDYITARISADYLEIMAQGSKDLYIRPKVSNSIQLHLKK